MLNDLEKRACEALRNMPHNMQMSYAFGVMGGAIHLLDSYELQQLHRSMSAAIADSRMINITPTLRADLIAA